MQMETVLWYLWVWDRTPQDDFQRCKLGTKEEKDFLFFLNHTHDEVKWQKKQPFKLCFSSNPSFIFLLFLPPGECRWSVSGSRPPSPKKCIPWRVHCSLLLRLFSTINVVWKQDAVDLETLDLNCSDKDADQPPDSISDSISDEM